MDSATLFVYNSTPSPPDNTALYTILSKIGLASRRLISSRLLYADTHIPWVAILPYPHTRLLLPGLVN